MHGGHAPGARQRGVDAVDPLAGRRHVSAGPLLPARPGQGAAVRVGLSRNAVEQEASNAAHTARNRNAVWTPLAGFLWFFSLIMWEILLGLLVSAVALRVNPTINVRRAARLTLDPDRFIRLDRSEPK